MNEYLVAPRAKSIEDARAFIDKINTGVADNEWLYWAITLKNDNKLIGTICFWNIVSEENKAEIGYVLHPAMQDRGLMQEATTRVIEYGFENIKLGSIEAVLHPGNAKSVTLLKKNAFVYESESGNEIVYRLINPFAKEAFRN